MSNLNAGFNMSKFGDNYLLKYEDIVPTQVGEIVVDREIVCKSREDLAKHLHYLVGGFYLDNNDIAVIPVSEADKYTSSAVLMTAIFTSLVFIVAGVLLVF